MARGVTFAASGALLVVACNAFTGVSDLRIGDGTSSPGVPEAGTDSAALETDSGSSPDGALDGDSGTIVVTDLDAGADSDAAPLGFCASLSPAPSLCTDFDDNVFPGPWTPSITGPGTASLVTSTFRSSPRALQLG